MLSGMSTMRPPPTSVWVMKAVVEAAKTSSAPASAPGSDSGTITVPSRRNRLPPRASAAGTQVWSGVRERQGNGGDEKSQFQRGPQDAEAVAVGKELRVLAQAERLELDRIEQADHDEQNERRDEPGEEEQGERQRREGLAQDGQRPPARGANRNRHGFREARHRGAPDGPLYPHFLGKTRDPLAA